jgi:hypothetical protein
MPDEKTAPVIILGYGKGAGTKINRERKFSRLIRGGSIVNGKVISGPKNMNVGGKIIISVITPVQINPLFMEFIMQVEPAGFSL